MAFPLPNTAVRHGERLLPTPRDASAVTWPPVSYWFLKSCDKTTSCNIVTFELQNVLWRHHEFSHTAECLFAVINRNNDVFCNWEVFSQSLPIHCSLFPKGVGMERTFTLYNHVFVLHCFKWVRFLWLSIPQALAITIQQIGSFEQLIFRKSDSVNLLRHDAITPYALPACFKTVYYVFINIFMCLGAVWCSLDSDSEVIVI